jgi:hypothetical protein
MIGKTFSHSSTLCPYDLCVTTHGESRTQFLLVDLQKLPDRRFISFTLFESHRSYEPNFLGLTGDPDVTDQGTVFHIRELAEVYARNRDVAGLSFEVQVWDPSILPVSAVTFRVRPR